jgi:hypothetical protein
MTSSRRFHRVIARLRRAACRLRSGPTLMQRPERGRLGALLLSARVDARPRADVATAASDAIRHLDLQTELPREPRLPELHLSQPLLHWPSGVTLSILAASLLVAAGVLYAFRNEFPIARLLGRGSAWRAEPPDQPEGGSVRRGPEVGIKADDLAREGRFVEAMHLLLLQSLIELRRRLHIEFADSLTSREILRHPSLSDQSRTLLHDIVARVEWCYFGGYPAALADYVACSQSFHALLEAGHGEHRG